MVLHALSQNETLDVRGRGAKRHADADFARPPRDVVGFQPVDANRREQQRQHAECAEDGRGGADAPFREAAIAMLRSSSWRPRSEAARRCCRSSRRIVAEHRVRRRPGRRADVQRHARRGTRRPNGAKTCAPVASVSKRSCFIVPDDADDDERLRCFAFARLRSETAVPADRHRRTAASTVTDR